MLARHASTSRAHLPSSTSRHRYPPSHAPSPCLVQLAGAAPGCFMLNPPSSPIFAGASLPQRFASQRGRSRGDLPALIHEMGLEQVVLNQPWAELSVRGPLCSRSSCQSRINSALQYAPLSLLPFLTRPRGPSTLCLQGGQSQRVMLAITMALKPAVLLLDEPTSSLDPQSVLRWLPSALFSLPSHLGKVTTYLLLPGWRTACSAARRPSCGSAMTRTNQAVWAVGSSTSPWGLCPSSHRLVRGGAETGLASCQHRQRSLASTWCFRCRPSWCWKAPWQSALCRKPQWLKACAVG